MSFFFLVRLNAMLDKPKVKATNEGDFQAMATTGQVSRNVNDRSVSQGQYPSLNRLRAYFVPI
jgi:hypothetical protein